MKRALRSILTGMITGAAFGLSGLLTFAATPAAAQTAGSALGSFIAPDAHPQSALEPLLHPVYGLAGECHAIDFNAVDIQWNRAGGYYQLTVSGLKRFANMRVSLSHKSYGARPPYWATVVVGCWKNFIVIPIPTPYYVTMPLTQFVGTRGVEIVGATKVVRRRVPRS